MFVELAFYVSENISHSSERCGRAQPSVCLCSASWLRSCAAEKTFECECVTLLRSGTLTVAFWLSRSPFPTLLFFSFTPLFARSPAKILFSASFHCYFCFHLWVEISSCMKIAFQLTTTLQPHPSDAAGASCPLSLQFAFFNILTLATCLPGVTQLSRFDGCATLHRKSISRVPVRVGPEAVATFFAEFMNSFRITLLKDEPFVVQRKLEESQRREGQESNKCSLN